MTRTGYVPSWRASVGCAIACDRLDFVCAWLLVTFMSVCLVTARGETWQRRLEAIRDEMRAAVGTEGILRRP